MASLLAPESLLTCVQNNPNRNPGSHLYLERHAGLRLGLAACAPVQLGCAAARRLPPSLGGTAGPAGQRARPTPGSLKSHPHFRCSPDMGDTRLDAQVCCPAGPRVTGLGRHSQGPLQLGLWPSEADFQCSGHVWVRACPLSMFSGCRVPCWTPF